MEISIRKSVLANLNNTTHDDMRNTIEDAITVEEEKILPGLGVLFEVLWQKSTNDQKNQIVNSLVDSLK